MCGICGEFTFTERPSIGRLAPIVQMMERRGPDDDGLWTDQEHVALGFRRLAILDLSPTGHQPMLTQDERYAIIYNGEMYNFLEIKRDLERAGIRFRSTGDTEIVLYALATWGISALERFNGMFALAFYDSQEKTLLLARDHAGIKPLYFAKSPQGLCFASQYDQIMAHPFTAGNTVNPTALAMYMSQGYIPAPHAILENTSMLEAGSWLKIEADGTITGNRYYEFPQNPDVRLSGREAVEAVDAVVTEAVRRQMISDVPLATFLSGGIDSPLVAAKAAEISHQIVKAFTIGTGGDVMDESTNAAYYAHILGLEHIVEHFTPDQALQMLDAVIQAGGEPFADFSIFPTMLVSGMARQHVTVMLSGDGGDELFWGYPGRFGSVLASAEDFRQAYPLRRARWGAKKYLNIGDGHPNLSYATIGDWYQEKHAHIKAGHIAALMPDLPDWTETTDLFRYDGTDQDQTAQWMRWNEFTGHLTRVLLKVDRASMVHSLEVRVPLLDRAVIDVATKIDWRSCLDLETGMGKLPLRKVLAKHVEMQSHEKRGFSVPMSEWMRGPLKPHLEAHLLDRTELLGVPFNQAAMRDLVQQHQSGVKDLGWGLWSLLSLALWEDCYR